MSSNFVHLHNHSEYSLLDGACKVPELIAAAVEMGMPAIALTDHGALFGAIEFYLAAKSAGIKPIIGCEAYICKDRNDKSPSQSGGSRGEYAHHLLLLSRNADGFRNLSKLSSIGYVEGFYYRPRIDHATLAAHSAGLIATTGCMSSEVPSLLMNGDDAGAWERAKWYKDLFGENYYVEIQWHHLEPEKELNRKLIELSKKLDSPLIATNDTHYLRKSHAEAHDCLLCIGTGANVSDASRMRFDANEFYLKTPEEMAMQFAETPDALSNTMLVADSCDLKLDFDSRHLPHFPLPKSESDENSYLRKLAIAGLNRRFASPDSSRLERLESELAMIARTGFAGYFLIVADFVRFARDNGIPVGPGRGSAAGSLVCYSLGITNLDPIRFDLYFERFLNPERISMPDIDIDFHDEGRERVIEYVREKYGEQSVAQIITFGRLKAKAVVRDVARVLGVSYGDADKLAKLIPDRINSDLKSAVNESPDLKEALSQREDYRKVWEIGTILEGTCRHASTHAAGVVITPGPLTDYVPLFKQSDGSITTQFDMNMVEKIGLLKMDFLGLRTLNVIQNAQDMLASRDIYLDLDGLYEVYDEKTYDMLGRGDTTGVFQLESSGMREWLTKLKPTRIDDIVAMVALYRPGPMEMIGEFIARKHGQTPISYVHPSLKPILEPTYGVIVYQEQVLRIARDIAGFTLARADILRKAMGKKKKEEMERVKAEFIDGCVAHSGINRKLSGEIYELCRKFSEYGFVKAHAACYAVLAFQTAYLKANYPAEFLAAQMSSLRGDTKQVLKLVNDARRAGIALLPPDINTSSTYFSVENGCVRCGLESIKNVGSGAVQSMLSARETAGPFKSFYDLALRVDTRLLNKKVLESLIGSGALDGIGGHRAQFMAGLGSFFDYANQSTSERDRRQSSLFGGNDSDPSSSSEPLLPDVAPYTMERQLTIEKQLIGFYVSGHPLESVRGDIEKISNTNLGDLSDLQDQQTVRIAGIIVEIRRSVTKKGRPMATLTVEDFSGTAEILVFPDVLEKYTSLITKEAKVVVAARVTRREEEEPKFIALDLFTIEEAKIAFARSLWISLSDLAINEDTLNGLEDLFLNHSGDVPVYFKVAENGKERIVRSRRYRLKTSLPVLQHIQQMLGEEKVELRLQ